MPLKNKTLNIGASPHINSGLSVEHIMRNVVWAILPIVGFAIYAFGLTALLTIITAVLACVLTEHWFSKGAHAESTISDWSVVITGLLYGLTLPPGIPLWMVFCGGVIGVAIGKVMFGGLGFNPFNPALVGRAFLQAAFPVSMTTWMPVLSPDRFVSVPASVYTFPFATPIYDVVSGATPLAAMKFDSVVTDTADLVMGMTAGSVGETSSLVILLGGLYLIYRKMMNWRIPAGIFASVILLTGILHGIEPTLYPTPQFMLFSGGLMLGAMFMATDMVASPITSLGCFVYGAIIGILVVVIRIWGGIPEGVMYAILFANALSPHIDRIIRPIAYGTRRQRTSHGN